MNARVPAEAFPPGDTLREELEERGWSQLDLAEIIGKTPATINEILSGKRAVTTEMACALADALGTSPEFWLNLESSYRLSKSRESNDSIRRKARLYEKAPIGDMLKRGWLNRGNLDELERDTLRFFNIKSLDETPQIAAAARKTSYAEDTPAQLAWYFRAKHLAEEMPASTFSKEDAVAMLKSLQSLTIAPEEIRKVPGVLGEMGVRFVVVEHLPKTRVDGAALWLDGSSPAIALSLRHSRIDAFWHSLMHELGHVIEGHMSIDSRLVGNDRQSRSEKPEIEQDADDFASRTLVPQDRLDDFVARVRPLYSKVKIMQFANTLGVHPGILVGQLQYRGEIGYQHSREMLVSVRDIVTQSAVTDGWGCSL